MPSKKKYTSEELSKMAYALDYKPWEENVKNAESLVWRKANPDVPLTMGEWFVKERFPSKVEDPELKRKQERNLAFLIDIFVPHTESEALLPLIGRIDDIVKLYRGALKKHPRTLSEFVDIPGKGVELRMTGQGLYEPGNPTLWSATRVSEALQYPTTADIRKLPFFEQKLESFLGRKLKVGPEGDYLDLDLINRFRSTLGAMYSYNVPLDFIRKEARFGKYFGTREFLELEPKGHVVFPYGVKLKYLQNIHPYSEHMPIGFQETKKLVSDVYSGKQSLWP